MIILTTALSTVISHPSRSPLSNGQVRWTVYNKSTREEMTFNSDYTYSKGLIVFTLQGFDPVEGEQYYLTVLTGDGLELLFNSNMYCTNQTDLQDYQSTEGIYTEPTQGSNEFITR